MGKIFLMNDVTTSVQEIRSYMDSLRSTVDGVSGAVNAFLDSSLESAAYNALKEYFSGTFLELMTTVNNSCDSIASDCDGYASTMQAISGNDSVLRETQIKERIEMYQRLVDQLAVKRERFQALQQKIGLFAVAALLIDDYCPTQAELTADTLKKEWEDRLEKLETLDRQSENQLDNAQSEVSKIIALLSVDMGSFNIATGTYTINRTYSDLIASAKERQIERLKKKFKLSETQAKNILAFNSVEASEQLIEKYQNARKADRNVFFLVLDENYKAAFAEDPSKLSVETKYFLSSYSLHLMKTGQIDQIEAMTNGIYTPSYIYVDGYSETTGKPITYITGVNVYSDYFGIISDGINAELSVYNQQLLGGVSEAQYLEHRKTSDLMRDLANYYSCQRDLAEEYVTVDVLTSETNTTIVSTLRISDLSFKNGITFNVGREGGFFNDLESKGGDEFTYTSGAYRNDAWGSVSLRYVRIAGDMADEKAKERIYEKEKERDKDYENMIKLALAQEIVGYLPGSELISVGNFLTELILDENQLEEDISREWFEECQEKFGGMGVYTLTFNALGADVPDKDKDGKPDPVTNICYVNEWDAEKTYIHSLYQQTPNDQKAEFLVGNTTSEDYRRFKKVIEEVKEGSKGLFEEDECAAFLGDLEYFKDESGIVNQKDYLEALERGMEKCGGNNDLIRPSRDVVQYNNGKVTSDEGKAQY